jgi:hypothetical protein
MPTRSGIEEGVALIYFAFAEYKASSAAADLLEQVDGRFPHEGEEPCSLGIPQARYREGPPCLYITCCGGAFVNL